MDSLAMVTDCFPRLSETFIRRQASALSPLILSQEIDTETLASLSGQPYNLVGLSVNRSPLSKKIQWWLKVLKWKAFQYPSFYWDSATRGQLRKELLHRKPQLVLAQFGQTGINIMKVCQSLGLPFVVHFHGIDATQLLRNPYYLKDLKQLFKVAQALVVVNDYMLETFAALGCPKSKLHLISYGVPVPPELPKRKRSKEKFQFLSVGRMTEKKSPINTLKAFEVCADLHPEVHLNMIGHGELMAAVSEYVQGSRHSQKIKLLGALPFEEVQGYFFKADAFVQHSVVATNGDAEGWPLAIGEAAAAGLPVVATKHMGIPSQVVDGQTGFLVEENDYLAMGEKMAELAGITQAQYQHFSGSAYEHIRLNGNFSEQLRKLQALLDNSITQS